MKAIKFMLIALIIFSAGVVIYLTLQPKKVVTRNLSSDAREIPTDIENAPPIYLDVPKDLIPVIDSPKYEQAESVASWLNDKDLVIGVSIGGEARAYPLKILNWHEIVNENIGGEEVVITYSPLSMSGVVFSRLLDGKLLQFGNTGSQFESSMVMYDQGTGSYWYHVNGYAIKGPLTGKQLTTLPSYMTTWANWKSQNPQTLVLTTDTGFVREYLSSPYEKYYNSEELLFPVSATDGRLFGKTPVVGIVVNGKAKAYPILKEKIVDQFEGEQIEIENGKVNYPAVYSFWFSWVASYPETELWE